MGYVFAIQSPRSARLGPHSVLSSAGWRLVFVSSECRGIRDWWNTRHWSGRVDGEIPLGAARSLAVFGGVTDSAAHCAGTPRGELGRQSGSRAVRVAALVVGSGARCLPGVFPRCGWHIARAGSRVGVIGGIDAELRRIVDQDLV